MPSHPAPNAPAQRNRRTRTAIVAGLAVIASAVGITAGLIIANRSDTAGSTSAPMAMEGTTAAGETTPSQYHLTGQVGPMGGQLIETPGTRTGTASAAGVTVTDGSDIVMGHIPLAYAVNPTWHLKNTSSGTAAIASGLIVALITWWVI